MKFKKSIILLISILVFAIVFIIINKTGYKTINIGDNMNNKSISNIEKYIINIKSYETEATIKVISNKNENEYKVAQKFVSPNLYTMEILEPENLKGVSIGYNGNTLKISNSQLGLSKIYENYSEITNNNIFLNNFIKDYISSEASSYAVENEQAIFTTNIIDENKYAKTKKLYVDINTKQPIKLEIEDVNQKCLVYILYNEVTLNKLNKDKISI